MTKYFEVQYRDGAARIGKLILKTQIQTPFILKTESFTRLDSSIIYAKSLWGIKSKKDAKKQLQNLRNKVGNNVLIIIPDLSFPPFVHGIESLNLPDESDQIYEDSKGAIGTTIRVGKAHKKSDLYIIEGAGCFNNDAKAFLTALINLKTNTPSDTAVYAPNIATPESVAMLVYLGIDVMDDTRSILSAYNDMYLTTAGKFHLDSLVELPCKCNACISNTPKGLLAMDKVMRSEILKEHNINALESELAIVREKIRRGNLREYIEGQCRTSTWLTSLLRRVDMNYKYMEEKTSTYRSNTLLSNTSDSLNRPEIVRFANRIQTRYIPPKLDTLILFPCSAKKPYSMSNSHQKFTKAIGSFRKYVHEIIITSPLGIVPRELELTYPASHYDISVTGHWSADEHNFVTNCLVEYLSKHSYSTIIAHVSGAYQKICEEVADRLDIEIIYSCKENPVNYESLSNLKRVLHDIPKNRSIPKNELKIHTMRKIADYQFGIGAGEILIPDEAVVKLRFPKQQVYINKTQIATCVPKYGTLAITIEGAKLLLHLNRYIVEIEDFVPKGSILAPGVSNADMNIRPNDEVIVKGKNALCVGRADMSGKEMIESTRGIAVNLRHVRKL